MKTTFEELEQKVNEWATVRGIYDNSNALKQLDKTQEELNETRDSAVRLEIDYINHEKHLVDYKDGIGDVIVTMINAAKFHNLSIVECLEHSFNEIKNRTGKMVNGMYIKDTTNPPV